jgi:hypothetical protein
MHLQVLLLCHPALAQGASLQQKLGAVALAGKLLLAALAIGAAYKAAACSLHSPGPGH